MTGSQFRLELKKQNITQAEAAERLGISRNTILIWMNKAQLDDNTSSLISAKLGITMQMHSYSCERGTIRYWTDVDATGSGVFQFDDCDTERFIDLQIPGFEDCKDAINLYGDSMSPRYKSGQIILLKKWTENFIEYGNVYLVITKNGHRMVKMLRAIKDEPQMVLCVSENLAFDPFPINKEDVHSLFLVKGSIDKSTL